MFCRLHKLLQDEPYVHVHIGNLAAQTGVTRFTQINDGWKYSKNESLTLEQLKVFTHLLMEAKSKYATNIKALADTHDVIDTIDSFSHITMTYKIIPPLKIKTRPAIFILERRHFREDFYGISDSNFVDSPVRSIQADETVMNIVEYNSKEHKATQFELDKEIRGDDINRADTEVFIREVVYDQNDIYETESPDPEPVSELLSDLVVQRAEIEFDSIPTYTPKLAKAKKSLEEVKALREERKKKAIQKIKSETRKEVVASAKEKLREIMKRHKHIAEELTKEGRDNKDQVISQLETEEIEVDSPGDLPEAEATAQVKNVEIETKLPNPETEEETSTEIIDDSIQNNDSTNRPNENIDSIVEEVIARLLDRKIYDDKTKPEDIKAEDRLVIQKIVEEVLAERMNYTNVAQK